MRLSLREHCRAIEREAILYARESIEKLYYEHGGVDDPFLAREKLIADLGPKRAAELSRRFVELKASFRGFYGFRPNLAVEHIRLLQHLVRQGWIRLWV